MQTFDDIPQVQIQNSGIDQPKFDFVALVSLDEKISLGGLLNQIWVLAYN